MVFNYDYTIIQVLSRIHYILFDFSDMLCSIKVFVSQKHFQSIILYHYYLNFLLDLPEFSFIIFININFKDKTFTLSKNIFVCLNLL